MKKILLFLVSLAVGAGLLFWVFRSVGVSEIERSLKVFGAWRFLVIILITILADFVAILKWEEVLKGEGVRVSFRDLIKPFMAGYAFMFLAPILVWGGEILRGYILKKDNGVSWAKGMTSIIIDRIFEWTANLVVIVFGLSIFLARISILPKKWEFFFAGVLLIFAGSLFYFYSKVFKKESVVKAFAEMFGLKRIKEQNAFLETEKEIFDFFRAENLYMWRALALNFLKVIGFWVRTWFLIFFLGRALGVLSTTSILGFNFLALTIPIPATLGSQEAIQTFVFTALGHSASDAVAFSMIQRAADFLISLFGILILFRYGIYFINKVIFRSRAVQA